MCTVYTLILTFIPEVLEIELSAQKFACYPIILQIKNKCLSLCKRLHKFELKCNHCRYC